MRYWRNLCFLQTSRDLTSRNFPDSFPPRVFVVPLGTLPDFPCLQGIPKRLDKKGGSICYRFSFKNPLPLVEVVFCTTDTPGRLLTIVYSIFDYLSILWGYFLDFSFFHRSALVINRAGRLSSKLPPSCL